MAKKSVVGKSSTVEGIASSMLKNQGSDEALPSRISRPFAVVTDRKASNLPSPNFHLDQSRGRPQR
jgi:hypothetical protein